MEAETRKNHGILPVLSIKLHASKKFVTRITEKQMKLIKTVAKMKGGTLSEFCRGAILKEARLELMRFREDRIEMAKKILKEDEKAKQALEDDELDDCFRIKKD